MTTTNKTATQKNVTNVRLFVLFVLLMLSGTGVFAQNTTPATQVSKEAIEVIATENAVASASMDFAVWFVGAGKISSENNNVNSFSKKALLNSGVKTNNVLIRSILKKVSVQGNGIA